MFFLELFIMLYVTFLTSEIKFATSEIATIKMHLFCRTSATFSQFFLMQCNIFISIKSVGRQDDRMN